VLAEIIRCLKRYVARETYALLPNSSSFDSRSITYQSRRRSRQILIHMIKTPVSRDTTRCGMS